MANLEGLKEFVASKGGNRGKAEFFVGRKEELALIEDACIQAIRRKSSADRRERDNEPGGILFTGAPGMGKTALLMEGQVLAQGVSGNGPEEETRGLPRIVRTIRERLQLDTFGTPLVVRTAPGKLKTEKSLLHLCAEEARRLRDDARTRSLALGAGVLAEQFTNVDPDRVIGELGKIDVLERPLVVLMIDEAQHSDEDNTEMYENLHLGLHQLPIVPVFAGLSDSRAALKKAGISRFARRHYVEMKMLDDDDCKEAMEAFLDRYEIGVPECGRRHWKELAVEHGVRFPHHLNTVLIAAAETTIHHGGELDSSTIAGIGQAIERWKDGYYAEQAADFRPEEGEVAARIVEETVQKGKNPAVVASELLPDIPDPHKNEHGDIDVTGFIRRMEHCGMLWRAGANRYECPIPTFRDWLQREYGKGGTERPSPR